MTLTFNLVRIFLLIGGRTGARVYVFCRQYWQLDLNKSINDNLCNKLVYEYPTMHIVYGSATVEYQGMRNICMSLTPR